MLVLESDLTELAGGVWEAFLGMTAEPVPPAPGAHDGPVYTASVSISGGWEGSVTVAIPGNLARAAAAAMFGLSLEELGDDEVADAVGEIANIIGGNVKGMLEEECQLSLPVVAVGSNYSLSRPGAEMLQSVSLMSEGETFQVSVHRRTA